MSDHIPAIVTSCWQTLHALRVLRSQDLLVRLPAEALFEVYGGVVIHLLNSYCTLLYTGFAYADDKQRLAAFIRRSIRQGFCASLC